MPKEWFWFEAPKEARLEFWKMSPYGKMLDIRAYVTDYAIDQESMQESAWAS